MRKIICIILSIIMVFTPLLSDVKASAAYKATLIGIQDTGHDHTSYYSAVGSHLTLMGYNTSEIQESTDISRSSFLDIMDEREIIVIRSHGGYSVDGSGNLTSTWMPLGTSAIISSDFENLPSNLTNAKIFVFGGCNTAKGGPSDSTVRNLIVQANNKGVRVAIGFQTEVYCEGVNTWTKYFFWLLTGPSNVDQAAVGAVSHTNLVHWNMIDNGLNIDSMRYRGEWYMTF